MKDVIKINLIACVVLLLSAALLCGCSEKPKAVEDSTSEESVNTDLPVYTAEIADGHLRVDINDKDRAVELVVPKTENGVFVASCSPYSSCMYCDGYNNVPKIITAEDYENNIVRLAEASDISLRTKKKLVSEIYYVKMDITDPNLSTEDKEKIITKWPVAEFTSVYIFDTEASSREVIALSDVLTEIGYDADDCIADLENIRKIAEDNGISLDITHPSELEVPNYFTSIVFSEGTRQINDVCPYEYRYVKSIHIPNSVENIDSDAFYGLTVLNEIIYDGTMEEWNAILTENEYFHDLNVSVDVTVKCTDAEIIISSDF